MPSTESSVSSIISAFDRGVEVLPRLRGPQRQNGHTRLSSKKGSGKYGARGGLNEEELQLSTSLKRGSSDVQQVYAAHARTGGSRYAAGDTLAQSSLTQTLLRLNAGLVNIITSFLGCGRHEVLPDYRSLTSLSDASRLEAVDALSQLYVRLSRSDLDLQAPRRSHRDTKKQPSKAPNLKHCRSETTVRTASAAALPAGVAKVTTYTSQTQLALVRPKTRRKGSGTSSNASKTPRAASASSSQHSSTPSSPATAPPSYRATPPASPLALQRAPHSFPFPSQPQAQQQMQMQQVRAQAYQYIADPRPQQDRRISTSTFATDSTKLGEIPMRRWNTPYDFAEMERLNEQARLEGWRPVAPAAQEARRRGVFGRMFGRRG